MDTEDIPQCQDTEQMHAHKLNEKMLYSNLHVRTYLYLRSVYKKNICMCVCVYRVGQKYIYSCGYTNVNGANYYSFPRPPIDCRENGRDGGGKRERGREERKKHQHERNASICCLCTYPTRAADQICNQDTCAQLGIKPVTLRCTGRNSNH